MREEDKEFITKKFDELGVDSKEMVEQKLAQFQIIEGLRVLDPDLKEELIEAEIETMQILGTNAQANLTPEDRKKFTEILYRFKEEFADLQEEVIEDV